MKAMLSISCFAIENRFHSRFSVLVTRQPALGIEKMVPSSMVQKQTGEMV
jgi:hypothetical protein